MSRFPQTRASTIAALRAMNSLQAWAGDRDLDAMVQDCCSGGSLPLHVFYDHSWQESGQRGNRYRPPYTVSLDAARHSLPPGWRLTLQEISPPPSPSWRASLEGPGGRVTEYHASAAVAVVIAGLLAADMEGAD